MKITARQYADVLMQMTEKKSGKALESAVNEFVNALNERHELSRWREIVRAFDNAWIKKHGASNVHLETAYAPSKKLLEQIQEAFPEATLTHEVRAELVGGAILQVDDHRFDGSISGQMSKLHDQLVG